MPSLYLKLIAAALIFAAVTAGWLYVHHLRSEVSTLTTANTVLTTQLKTQNDAVTALKTEADMRLKAGQLLVEAANQQAAKNTGKAQIIYKKAPSVAGNDCASTLNLLNQVN